MADNLLQRALKRPKEEEPPALAPLGGTRSEAAQRLRIGIIGIVSMIFLVGMVDMMQTRKNEAEAELAPEPDMTNTPEAEPTQQSDPLTDAGVVPDQSDITDAEEEVPAETTSTVHVPAAPVGNAPDGTENGEAQ